MAGKAGFKAISRLLNLLNPFSDNDTFDRYAKFIKISRLGSQENIYKECERFYPKDTKFVVLPMDMAFMGAGKVPREYEMQIKELYYLKEKHSSIIPFIHIDPRRKEYLDLFNKSTEEWGFRGIKIYPSLGYFPFDQRLKPVFEYCCKNKLPVISHCGPYNPVHFRGSKKEIEELLREAKAPVDIKGKSKIELCSQFAAPRNWAPVLDQFQSLKLCLAHFGSGYYWKKYLDDPGKKDNWFVQIREMIEQYDNLYTDTSFTLSDQEYFSLLKVLLADPILKKRILFGSDYYMVETESNERRFGLDLRAYIGEENFMAIALTNPEKFLFQ
jgi:predicted TIM-barrel fold metal-dependent hydrolase